MEKPEPKKFLIKTVQDIVDAVTVENLPRFLIDLEIILANACMIKDVAGDNAHGLKLPSFIWIDDGEYIIKSHLRAVDNEGNVVSDRMSVCDMKNGDVQDIMKYKDVTGTDEEYKTKSDEWYSSKEAMEKHSHIMGKLANTEEDELHRMQFNVTRVAKELSKEEGERIFELSKTLTPHVPFSCGTHICDAQYKIKGITYEILTDIEGNLVEVRIL